MQEQIIPIIGMHCKACTIVISDELEKVPGVHKATANLKNNTATIKYTKKPSEQQIYNAVKSAGYSVGDEKKSFFNKDKNVYKLFAINLVTLGLIIFFLRGIGVTGLNLNSVSGSSALLALVVGVTAGFSTCMAMIGGLVLGISARYAENHPTATSMQKFRPHLFFNLGRILTFFVLGGFLGLFGSIFSINSSAIGFLTVVVGFVMVILGLQLTEIFPKISNKGFTLPTSLAKKLGVINQNNKEYSHKNSIFLGAASFFLPCGFTQAMQLLAISSGSFIMGSVIMGLFAIGTTPGLLGIGALISVVKGTFAKSFFRFVGVAVILLALYNISNGLNLMGYKIARNNTKTSSNVVVAKNTSGEILSTSFTVAGDISPSSFNIEVGKQYILEVDAKEDGQGCMSTIMIPGVYKNPLLIKKGKLQLPFTIDKPGSYQITCAMGIPRGTINAIKTGL